MSNTTRRGRTSRTVRVRDLVALIVVTGAAVGAAGCSSSNSTAPPTGSLTVTIVAPSGVTPSVTVSGPGGYNKALSATTRLTGLAAGNYAVTAAPVTTTDAIVGTVNTATVSGSPATVAAGGATANATATYTLRPGSGGLWVANAGAKTVVQYTAGQLGSATSAPPATAIGTRADYNEGVAFDANGNLWVTQAALSNAVLEYTASQLSASGTPTPAVTLSGGSLDVPIGLAFDASGNLWVANLAASSVVEFTVSQLASSGSATPAVALSASSGSLNGPVGLAFDASGNLWVANNGPNTVVEFTVSQLAATGSPTPAVTLSATAGSIASPQSIAFDAHGNLWLANGGDTTVVAFSPSQLASTGTPTPAVTLSATAGSLNGPEGLAFDASGNLWVANFVGPSVVEFTASQLVVSGSPTPNVTASGSSLVAPVGLAFDPHAAGLPLKP
jgi:sugar lactone lactonase YvrE